MNQLVSVDAMPAGRKISVSMPPAWHTIDAQLALCLGLKMAFWGPSPTSGAIWAREGRFLFTTYAGGQCTPHESQDSDCMYVMGILEISCTSQEYENSECM